MRLLAFVVFAAAEAPPPGWSVEFKSDGASPASVVTHAEAAAFVLGENESPHPEIASDGFTARFAGDLKIARGGMYRFTLDVAGGQASLIVHDNVSGADVRADDGNHAAPPTIQWIELKPGLVRLSVEFARHGHDAARLRTSWEMKPAGNGTGFVAEPIPSRDVRVPDEFAPRVAVELAARRGRVALTELGCANCHAAGAPLAGLVSARGKISLARILARADEGWLRKWISAPQEMNPGCGMPDVIGESKQELADVDALMALFRSLAPDVGAPPTAAEAPPDAAVVAALVARGKTLFHEVGCSACHGPLTSAADAFGEDSFSKELPRDASAVAYGDLGNKWRADELAKFLVDPVAVRTHGRMPSLGLELNDASAIAHYLVNHWGAAPPAARFVVDVAQAERGKQVFNTRGCAQCHTLGEGLDAKEAPFSAPPLPNLTTTTAVKGCLATSDANRGKAPRYRFSDAQHAELSAGLLSVQQPSHRWSGAAAPLTSVQQALLAFRCTKCHLRDGEGGIAENLLPYFRSRVEADLGDEGRLPPRLDGVGLRMQSPWLERVIAEGARARPYLSTRMPHFGADVGRQLATGFAALEGEWRSDDSRHQPEANAATPTSPTNQEDLATIGRKLAGASGLNCITCHSFGARPSAGTPGLDFTQLAPRIRKEWWQRYALSPLRFKPGTRMPTFFDEGKSSATTVFDGKAGPQIDALWAWFEKAGAMPAPEGVPTGERMVLDVGDRPKVFRTFMERAGNRAIAVGYPAGLHFAFDAEQIRLCEAWRGEFLDVAPVWTGRGGTPAPELGPLAWTAAAGPELMLARAGEPHAASWPIDSGRNHGLKFRGYRLDADGTPNFLYQLRDPATKSDVPPLADAVEIEARFVPDARQDVLFRWSFTIRGASEKWDILLRPEFEKLRVGRESNGRRTKNAPTAGAESWTIAAVDRSKPIEIEFEVPR